MTVMTLPPIKAGSPSVSTRRRSRWNAPGNGGAHALKEVLFERRHIYHNGGPRREPRSAYKTVEAREAHHVANETGQDVTVTHLPPGASKSNKIQHRLFVFTHDHAMLRKATGATWSVAHPGGVQSDRFRSVRAVR
jgi:hypothetical protein